METATMAQVIVKAGTMVHVNGFPVWLTADTTVECNAANVPLLELDKPRGDQD